MLPACGLQGLALEWHVNLAQPTVGRLAWPLCMFTHLAIFEFGASPTGETKVKKSFMIP